MLDRNPIGAPIIRGLVERGYRGDRFGGLSGEQAHPEVFQVRGHSSPMQIASRYRVVAVYLQALEEIDS